MLEIVAPLSIILSAIDVGIDALSIGLVVNPVSLVDVTVHVPEDTLSVGPVVLPLALVLGAIGPDLGAVAISEATDPLTLVRGSVLKPVNRPLLPLRTRVVLAALGKRLPRLLQGEVLALVLRWSEETLLTRIWFRM